MLNNNTKIFIFARNKSRGIKNKNLIKFYGKPLIYYSLEMALSLTKPNNIFISSDSMKYKKVANYFKINFIKRPNYLASSKSPEILSWKHAINFLKKKKINIKTFLSLPTTSPLRSKTDVLETLKKLKSKTDIVLTASDSSRNPYFNIVEKKRNGYYGVVNNKSHIFRRQDAPKTFDLNTVAFASKPNFILKTKSIFNGNVDINLVPKERSIDIDNRFDFKLAVLLVKNEKKNNINRK